MPALFALLSAACAILVPNYQHVQRPAKQPQAAVMHVGKHIPELIEIYELAPLITYDGWEREVRSLERKWLRGSEVDIQREVAKMRRWQCLHDGDRTDAALQVLDAVKQGLTYKGWEKDVRAWCLTTPGRPAAQSTALPSPDAPPRLSRRRSARGAGRD